MHNSPSEKLSGSSAPRKNSGFTHYKLPAAITIAGLAALFAMRGDDNDAKPTAEIVPAPKATDLDTTNIAPVSALTPFNVEEMDPAGDAVQAKPVSFEKPIEKAPLKPGKPTIEELPEGVVQPNTNIRLRAGGKEGALVEFILSFDEAGIITINGKKYEQVAKAYKKIPVLGIQNVSNPVLKWSRVEKITTEDGPALQIFGEPIDGSDEGSTDISTESDLVVMCANADGEFKKPLGMRLGKNPVTGKKDVEVHVDWTIAPAKK